MGSGTDFYLPTAYLPICLSVHPITRSQKKLNHLEMPTKNEPNVVGGVPEALNP